MVLLIEVLEVTNGQGGARQADFQRTPCPFTLSSEHHQVPGSTTRTELIEGIQLNRN